MASVPTETAKSPEAKAVAPAAPAQTAEVKPVVAAKTVAPAPAKAPAEPVKTAEVKPVAAKAAKPVSKRAAPVRKAAATPAAKIEKAPARAVAKRNVNPVRKAAVVAKKGTFKMNEAVKNVEETVKKATAEAGEKATEMLKDMTSRAKGAVEKATEMSKDMVEFNKANLEAFVEAGKIAVKGTQNAAQNAAEYSRKNFEATTAMLKSAAAVKSPTELFKLQGDFARSQFDGAVAEMSKSTEFTLKLMGEVFQPLQNRYSVVAEEMKTRLAA
jgi:phasin family protein